MQQYTVIGLGRFGLAASQELIRLGHQVIGIDFSEKLINKVADKLTVAAVIDATDEEALKELNVNASDAVLVAIGENLEASMLCVLTLKTMGVEEIWVKATSKQHHMILSKLGVARVIHPEEEMGIRVAQSLNYPMVNQYMSIGHQQYLVEVIVTEKQDGSKLKELIEDKQNNISALTVQRKTDAFNHPDSDFILNCGDSLILSGSINALKGIAPKLLNK